MDDSELEVTAEDHLERCRLCLKLIGESDIIYKVSESTKIKFEKLTSHEIELNISQNLFSPLICVACNRDLNKYSNFRDELIRKQSKLYEIVFGGKFEEQEEITDEHELVQEDVAVQEVEEDENLLDECTIQEVNEEILDEEMIEQFCVDDEQIEGNFVEEAEEADTIYLMDNGEFFFWKC